MPPLYILNTPILTEYGSYDFRKANLPEVKALLSQGFTSAIGHEVTASLISQLTGVSIPVNRVAIKMQPGDIAIVFRILTRLPEGKVLTQEELSKVPYEFGILKKHKHEWLPIREGRVPLIGARYTLVGCECGAIYPAPHSHSEE